MFLLRVKFDTLIPWILPLLDMITDEEKSYQEGDNLEHDQEVLARNMVRKRKRKTKMIEEEIKKNNF